MVAAGRFLSYGHPYNLSAEYGCLPMGALLIGQSSGNLYGTASEYGPNGGGTVFKLVPSNGGWTMSTIYPFTSCLPTSGVSMDSAGNLYGTCYYGASGLGSVFELTNCSQTCTLIDLHDFNGSDGQNPWGSVALDASGKSTERPFTAATREVIVATMAAAWYGRSRPKLTPTASRIAISHVIGFGGNRLAIGSYPG